MLKKTTALKSDYFWSVVTGYVLIAFNMIAQVFLMPLYIKYLGIYQYGVFLLIFSFINYAAIGIGFMSGGALRLLSENYSTKNFHAFSCSYMVSKLTYIFYGTLVGIAFVLYTLFIKGTNYFSQDSLESLKIICVTFLYIIIKYDFSIEIQLFTGMQQQCLSNIFQILTQLLYLVFVIPYMVFYPSSIYGILFFNLLGLLLVRVIIELFKKKRKIDVRLKKHDQSFIPIFKKLFGKMGMGYMIYGLIIITYQADILLMGTINNKAELITQYAMIWKVAEAGIMLLWKIPETMQPYIIKLDAQGEYRTLKKQYSHIYKLTFGLSAAASIGFALFGKIFLKLWMGAAYIPISNVAILLTASAIFFDGIKRTPCIYAYSLVKLKGLNVISGIETFLKVIFIAVLFPKIGILAPILTRNILAVGGFAYCYWNMGKRLIKT